MSDLKKNALKLVKADKEERARTIYQRYAGATFSEFIDQQAREETPTSTLNEELALFRDLTARYVGLYADASQLLADNPENKEAQAQVFAIGEQMAQMLERAQKFALQAQALQNNAASGLTQEALTALSLRLTDILYQVCGTKHIEIAQEFENEMVKVIQTDAITPTTLEPANTEDLVIEMDCTIPADEGVEEAM